MSTQVARFPFVSKDDILRAFPPGTEPSESTFKTLRRNGLVSAGVSIRRRRAGRVVGQLRCYAAVNIDAVVLARHGRSEEASEVAGKATQFEAEWQPLVSDLAREFHLYHYEAFWSARNQIAHALSPAAKAIELLHNSLNASITSLVSEEFVRIGQITHQWAALQIVNQSLATSIAETIAPINKALESIVEANAQATSAVARAVESIGFDYQQFMIDAFLPRAALLNTGDLALLRIEQSAGSSLLSLLAAIQEEEPFELDKDIAPYFTDEPLPPSVLEYLAQRIAARDTIKVPPRTIPLAS